MLRGRTLVVVYHRYLLGRWSQRAFAHSERAADLRSGEGGTVHRRGIVAEPLPCLQ